MKSSWTIRIAITRACLIFNKDLRDCFVKKWMEVDKNQFSCLSYLLHCTPRRPVGSLAKGASSCWSKIGVSVGVVPALSLHSLCICVWVIVYECGISKYMVRHLKIYDGVHPVISIAKLRPRRKSPQSVDTWIVFWASVIHHVSYCTACMWLCACLVYITSFPN